jgi:hypothetical protein
LKDKLSYLKSTWIFFFEFFATGHQLTCLIFEDKSTKKTGQEDWLQPIFSQKKTTYLFVIGGKFGGYFD